MEKKSKSLVVRLSEKQFRELTSLLIEGHRSKSSAIREIFRQFIEERKIKSNTTNDEKDR